jgi:hypothetical protein
MLTSWFLLATGGSFDSLPLVLAFIRVIDVVSVIDMLYAPFFLCLD